MNKQRGFWALLLSAFLFSFSGVAVRNLGSVFSDYGQVIVRFALVIFTLGLLFLIKKTNLKLNGVNKWALAIFILFQPIGNIAFAMSVMTIKATNTLFYLYLAQFVVGIIVGMIFIKEKFSVVSGIAFVFALAGLLFFAWPLNASFLLPGVWFGLVCGLSEGLKNAAMKYLKGQNKFVLAFYQYGFGILMPIIILLYLRAPLTIATFQPITAFWLAIMLIIALGITWMLLYGFANFDLNIGNIIVSSELLFATFFNFIFLGEIPTSNEYIGIGLLLSALVLVQLSQLRFKPKQTELLPA